MDYPRRLQVRPLKNTAILLVSCPDRKGIAAAIAGFLYENDANILHADQHQDAQCSLFLTRIEWDLADFKLSMEDLAARFEPIASRFRMEWRVSLSRARPRVAIFVSKFDHCLADILYRHRSGELPCEIALVIGNHEAGRSLAEFHGVPFHFIPVDAESKAAAEAKQLEQLERERVDLVVLARYMQVLSPEFVARYPRKIINIHHSFLPAFHGGRPYHRAFERGVKLIGATSHYVTDDLDEGPIIEQDVTRISHRDSLEDLVGKGRDLEKMVLSRAVRWHLESRILLYPDGSSPHGKTVIFD